MIQRSTIDDMYFVLRYPPGYTHMYFQRWYPRSEARAERHDHAMERCGQMDAVVAFRDCTPTGKSQTGRIALHGHGQVSIQTGKPSWSTEEIAATAARSESLLCCCLRL